MIIKKSLLISFISALFLTLGTAPVVLADSAGEEQEMKEAQDKYNEKMDNSRRKVVCKKEAKTGTRIKTKVCRTVYSMERDANSARSMMDRNRTAIRQPQPN